jgi:hypothetical protein
VADLVALAVRAAPEDLLLLMAKAKAFLLSKVEEVRAAPVARVVLADPEALVAPAGWKVWTRF